MKVALWAEIRRLVEIEKLSGWAISRQLRCSRHTVAAVLKLDQLPTRQVAHCASFLNAHRSKINALLAKYPDLSAVCIHEEIARGPDGYTGTPTQSAAISEPSAPPAGASIRKSSMSRAR